MRTACEGCVGRNDSPAGSGMAVPTASPAGQCMRRVYKRHGLRILWRIKPQTPIQPQTRRHRTHHPAERMNAQGVQELRPPGRRHPQGRGGRVCHPGQGPPHRRGRGAGEGRARRRVLCQAQPVPQRGLLFRQAQPARQCGFRFRPEQGRGEERCAAHSASSERPACLLAVRAGQQIRASCAASSVLLRHCTRLSLRSSPARPPRSQSPPRPRKHWRPCAPDARPAAQAWCTARWASRPSSSPCCSPSRA